ncbi:hypothetical protein [Coraliomargarita parva]|uniref:hypothetical protein n=1 Tax=Coraliomargarita parva TaxID=3014050 RepID=UPI0022B2DEBB|nr:hypothetical protein [Coraliomargarita parva]
MQFEYIPHPFVWTTASDRKDVLANVNEPIWHRFLEEAEAHFVAQGELSQAQFPVFCHDGDLDEVMAVCVLATVRNDPKLWHWIGDWLRGALTYYRKMLPQWQENRYRIMRGEQPEGYSDNPRQFFEGFTRGVAYWVEAGLSSVLMHLLDQLEAYAPEELLVEEKRGLLEALGDYANRYAFHEERLKYNNRGMWANAAILLASIAREDERSGRLLRFQAERRNAEFRSTFLDDGFHVEGAPDYHLMAADGLLAYLLTASHLTPKQDLFAGHKGEGAFETYPSYVDIIRAYLHTVIPGPVLMNHPRGCSISAPVTVRPALVQAWHLSGDPELGWLLRTRMGEVLSNPDATPLKVTNAALLGLGHYQPLLNFWLYRPVDKVHAPQATYHNMSGYGTVFSRSSWESDASCMTARYGYEGTGKGHRDHGHVTVDVGGVRLLKDPFPRYGPEGLDTAMFHNTVMLDEKEPMPVVGVLQDEFHSENIDAFMLANQGGQEPDRLFLGDPAEETHYWFNNEPVEPDFAFQRAVIHWHGHGLVLVDKVTSAHARCIDWFFHSDVPWADFDASATGHRTSYQPWRRLRVLPAKPVEMAFRGESIEQSSNQWATLHFADEQAKGAQFQGLSLNAPMRFDFGHCTHPNDTTGQNEEDYYLRGRCESASAQALWVLSWGSAPLVVEAKPEGEVLSVKLCSGNLSSVVNIDFKSGKVGN